MLRTARIVSFGVLLLAPAGMLFGQAHRAIILGQVTDTSGAVIAGAEVSVIQKSTNVSRVTRTNEDGHYEVPGLLPDTYRVEAKQTGFKTAVVDDIAVSSGRTVEIDLHVELGEVRESVTVEADKQILDTASADVNTVIGSRQVADLPIGQGHAEYLFLMVPGADSASSAGRGGSGMDIQPIQRQGTSQTRFNGSPQGTTEYTLDGTPNTQRGNSLPGGGSSFNPSAEVVQEVRVQTATFDASVGHTGGATVDLVLKSGTNDYHGNAVAFVRDPGWNANSWSGNRGGVPRPDFTYRRWGLSGGGPVNLGPLYKGKDKTFFYYGFEKWSSLSPNPPTFITVPQPQELTGDFSALLKLGPQYQLYDPNTARVAAGGRIQRDPFPGNVIPSNRIDPAAQALSKFWPVPNAAGTADGQLNFSYNNAPNPRQYWASTLRVDHNLSNAHKLFGRMIVSDSGIPFDTAFGRTDIPGLNLDGKNRDGALSDVWTISPSFVGDFRLSDTRFIWTSTPLGQGMPYSGFGLNSLSQLLDTGTIGLPKAAVTGYSFLNNQSAGSYYVSEIRSLGAHFTKLRGDHGFKFGADIRWYIENRGSLDLMSYNFGGGYTSGPLDNSPAPPIGSGLADFLLGRFASATASQPSKAANLSTYQGFYFQDDWKVNRRLTLNLGIRYEREGPPTERFNRALAGFDVNAASPIAARAAANYAQSPVNGLPPAAFQVRGGVLFAGIDGHPRAIYQTDNNNFGPRVGMAYQLNNSTVLRGGYGMFYIPNGQRFAANAGGVPGFDVSTVALSTPDNGLSFNRAFDNPFPGGLEHPTGTALGLATFLGQNISLQPFGENPNAYNQRWEFSIERRLGSNYRLEARYVGNHTVKMPIAHNLNALPDSYLSRSPERDNATINFLTSNVANPFFGLPNVGGSLGTSRTVQASQLLRPFPEFGTLTYYSNQGWSTYHSLQVELQRSFSSGLSFQTSFTWSKTLDGLSYLNEGDLTPERVISVSDRPFVWRLIALYELPFGRGKRCGGSWPAAPRFLISGWQVQGMSFLESGIPLSWGDVLFRGDIHNIPVAQQTPERMFDTNAGFERSSALQLANNLRTFPSMLAGVRSSSETDTDLSLIKSTVVHDRFTFQFRAEAYNIFNEHFFVSANTNPANAAFGTTTSVSSPRAVQLGVKFLF